MATNTARLETRIPAEPSGADIVFSPLTGSGSVSWSEIADAVGRANSAVWDKASADTQLAAMGTTLTAAWSDGTTLTVAHLCRPRSAPLRRPPLPRPTAAHSPAGAGIPTKIGNHTFRATGITAYLKNGGTLENAAAMANPASTPTTAPSARPLPRAPAPPGCRGARRAKLPSPHPGLPGSMTTASH